MSFLAVLEGRSTRVPNYGMVTPGLFQSGPDGRASGACMFESRAAYNRFIELLETSDRVQTSFSMYSFRGAGTEYLFIRDNVLVAKWLSDKHLYFPDLRFRERPIDDFADAWSAIRRCEESARKRVHEDKECDLGTALRPTNPFTSINLDFRPDTYWPLRAPSPKRDYTTLVPDPGPVRTVVDLAPDGITGLSGEGLPKLESGEVEIARLTYLATSQHVVTSLCARMEAPFIRYRLVSDHADPKSLECQLKRSARPLTLSELVGLLDSAVQTDSPFGEGLYFGALNYWLNGGSLKPVSAEKLRGAIRVDSAFYPALARWYDETFEVWCERDARERGTTRKRRRSRKTAADKSDGEPGEGGACA